MGLFFVATFLFTKSLGFYTPMKTLQEGLSDYRKSHIHLLPKNDVLGIRFNKLTSTKIRAQAAVMKTSPSELLRMLVSAGAESYGWDIDGLSFRGAA